MLKFQDFLKESFFKNEFIVDKNGKQYPIFVDETTDKLNFIVEEDSQEIAHIVLSKNEVDFLPVLDAWTHLKHRGLGIWKASMVFIKNYVQQQGYKGIMSEGQYRRPASDKSWKNMPNKTEFKNILSKKLDYYLESLQNDELDLSKFDTSKVNIISKTKDYIFYKADTIEAVQAILDIWPDIQQPLKYETIINNYIKSYADFYMYLTPNKADFLLFLVKNNGSMESIENAKNVPVKLTVGQITYFNKLFKIIDTDLIQLNLERFKN